jgi:hypothetical protein
MRILVTGSRDWTDGETVENALEDLYFASPAGELVTIVHGACPTGADMIAAEWVEKVRAAGWFVEQERHPAKAFGRWPACGPLRNRHMVGLGADVCLAFLGPCTSRRCQRVDPHPSHGTSGCVQLAREAGIPVRPFTSNGGAA